jgi:hypothetical protein
MSERKHLKETYGDLFTELSHIFYRLDPIGYIVAHGANPTPDDEFDLTVYDILPELPGAQSVQDVERIIRDVLVEHHSTVMPGPDGKLITIPLPVSSLSNVREIAQEVWSAWRAYQSSP